MPPTRIPDAVQRERTRADWPNQCAEAGVRVRETVHR